MASQKAVQFLQWLAFSGLDHQRACHRPADCGCMKAVVNQALGDVGDFDARTEALNGRQSMIISCATSASVCPCRSTVVMIFESSQDAGSWR